MKNYNQPFFSMKRENKKILFLFVLAALLILVFYNTSAEGNYGWNPEFLKVLLVFIVIISFMIIKVFLKSIIDSIKYKTKTSGYKRSLSEIYSPDYYKCSAPNYDNSKRIENLQKLYPLIDKATRDRNCKSYEDFLLYKFGQVIFTHNSDNEKKSPNKVDYKIVNNGLNKFFPENNFEPVDIETINKRENFATKLAKFASQWGKLQTQYSDYIYKIPEWGTLFTVITLKEENPRVLYPLKNKINDICDNFEKNKCYGYRKLFITVANKLYHEKDSSRENLSGIIQSELIDALSKRPVGLIKFTRKIDKVFVSAMPLFVYFYSLAFMIYLEPEAELLNQLVISFPVAIFSIFLKRFIKNKQGDFKTIAQYERLVKEESEFFQHKDEIIKAHVYESMNKQTFTSEYKEQNNKRTTSSYSYSNEEKNTTYSNSEKKEKDDNGVYCKYCGTRRANIFQLTHEHCRNSPSHYHVKYESNIIKNCYCEYCGTRRANLFQLANEKCNNKSPNGYHIPYEGSEKQRYTCRFCGHTDSKLFNLTHHKCDKNDTGHCLPLRD